MGTVSVSGSTSKMDSFLKKLQSPTFFSGLDRLAQRGVTALEQATPKDSGNTANQWKYEVETSGGRTKITWTNGNIVNGVPVVILLQYGHATGTGGYVQGRDFINPAIKPIFDEIADNMWKKVTLA